MLFFGLDLGRFDFRCINKINFGFTLMHKLCRPRSRLLWDHSMMPC